MGGFMRSPGEGDAYLFGNALFTLKATAADSAGQLAVMVMVCPPGLVESGHMHPGEDEIFYILEGELSVFCAGDQWLATPGSLVFLPRDIRHGFGVLGGAAAKVLIIVGPAHFDAHVAESGERQGLPL